MRAYGIILLAAMAALLLFSSSGMALDNDLYFSIPPDSQYSCLDVNLPQDLGTDITSLANSYIELDRAKNPWADVTYNKVELRPGMQTKTPVCFYHPGAKEGDFSFYSIALSSQELGVSKEISGGFCVADAEDVDNLQQPTNICDAMSQNSDIFDVQFKFNSVTAKPGDKLTQTFFVTSYANLRINLRVETDLSNDFQEETVSTASNPMVTKSFSIRVPDQEGSYNVKVIASVEGCSLSFCRREAEVTINAAESFVQTGFMASLIPKNINIKSPQKTYFRIIIKNYDSTKEFTVEASSAKPVTIEPKTATAEVDNINEKTLTFAVTPESGEKTLYTLNFRIRTGQTEKVLTSYLTVGELLSDAIQYAENVKATTPSTAAKSQIDDALVSFSGSYNTTSYGNELPDLEEFRKEVNNAAKTSGGSNTTVNPPPEEPAFNWLFVIIPIIIAVVIVVFVLYKKTRVVDELGEFKDYGRF